MNAAASLDVIGGTGVAVPVAAAISWRRSRGSRSVANSPLRMYDFCMCTSLGENNWNITPPAGDGGAKHPDPPSVRQALFLVFRQEKSGRLAMYLTEPNRRTTTDRLIPPQRIEFAGRSDHAAGPAGAVSQQPCASQSPAQRAETPPRQGRAGAKLRRARAGPIDFGNCRM